MNALKPFEFMWNPDVYDEDAGFLYDFWHYLKLCVGIVVFWVAVSAIIYILLLVLPHPNV